MELHRTRLFLLLAMFAVCVILYGEWQKEHPVIRQQTSQVSESSIVQDKTGVPDVLSDTSSPTTPISPTSTPVADAQPINISTDVFNIKINPVGGDITYVELLDYSKTLHSKDGVVLVESGTINRFIPQTGLIAKNDQGPDSKVHGRAHYRAAQTHYTMGNNDVLQVDLVWQHPEGVEVTKRYRFDKGSYVIKVDFEIKNETSSVWQGSSYGLLKQEYIKGDSGGMFGLQTYQGGAVHGVDKPYKKLSFSDMKKKPLHQQLEGGWAALVDHYFLCAWIPPKGVKNDYYSRVDQGDIYNIIVTTPVEVASGASANVSGQFYIGPEKADLLKHIAPGLELTIDYGILWPISLVLFQLLKWIHSFIGNWGWSIIFVTVIIKILFYKLSAASYRSMGKMRNLQPRMDALKEKHGDDRQGFSMAVMELYRKEKINPLGGCLPILIQIPVFIALYYVLLESIELRHAPFMFWIQDLSAKDPYYVLPLIMGATMFLQQKMNPAPPDPIQAKVMMFMPLVFTVLFLSFPSGLVLYWTVNNLLSILQQWHITRMLKVHK